jgi:hypothetical protein
MAVVAALLLACAALLLLLALGALSLPGASDGDGPRGVGLSRPRLRSRFRRSASESCVSSCLSLWHPRLRPRSLSSVSSARWS